MNINDVLEYSKNISNNLDNNRLENELNINSELENKVTINEKVLDTTIDNVSKNLEENITKEVENLNLNESVWEKISKSAVMDVVKVALEVVLKSVLKKKFGINFSTFNNMKDTLEAVMDGNLKDALKQGSDIALDGVDKLDNITKSAIKTVKNTVIDKTIDNEKYEILNKQTKILNRIGDNCDKFNEALKINDEKTMKNKINSIKKDMKEIIPIRETINKAQAVLDKYSLWQSKGNIALTEEETSLIDKLNNCA